MTTFDPWAYLKLIDIQDLDTKLDQINHKLSNLPERVATERLRAQQDQLKYREVAAITEVADRELEVRKAENDVEQVRIRFQKDSELLESGSITDSKQLTELQHEIESLKRRQNLLEDDEIAVMQLLEDAMRNLAEIRTELEKTVKDLAQAETELTVVVTNLEIQKDEITKERFAEAKSLPDELLKIYEKVRADNRGIGASRFESGQCDGCRIQFSNADMSKFRNSDPSELIRCDECRAILVKS